jgi:hypothetical protein
MKELNMKKFIVPALLIALLAACGAKLDGTYSDATKVMSLKFKSNGTVVQSAMGVEAEFKYVIEDKTVKLQMGDSGAKLALKIRDDGSLEFPMVGVLTKQK